MPRRNVIMGVDPGGKYTGLAVRRGNELIAHRVVTRCGGIEFEDHLSEIAASVNDMAVWWLADVVGVEATNPPTGQMGMTAVQGILDAAWVGGAAVAPFYDQMKTLLIVPPGKHGSKPRDAYPFELWGEHEGPAGQGILRHARSALDVSYAAETMLRQRDGEEDV